MTHQRSTRGTGLLEPWLARRRHAQAQRVIAQRSRPVQSILDIGCGTAPVFLRTLAVPHRYGLDKLAPRSYEDHGITVMPWDAAHDLCLPFEPERFDVITMLAVWEHIVTQRLLPLCCECYRCLKPGGLLIITTPSPLAQRILTVMARCGLVSREEIDEHVSVMNIPHIRSILQRAGFSGTDAVQGRRFLLHLNQLVTAIKQPV